MHKSFVNSHKYIKQIHTNNKTCIIYTNYPKNIILLYIINLKTFGIINVKISFSAKKMSYNCSNLIQCN